MDVLRAMHVFRLVSHAGSFAAAARTLEITTAWASKQVSQLETHVGAQLLNRTTRKLSLTNSGETYLEWCEHILSDVARAEEAIGTAEGTPRGQLKMTVPMSFGLMRIAPLLGEFSRRYPGIALDLTLNDSLSDLVDSGYDLAIRIAARLEDSSLHMRRLGSGTRVLCAAPSYLDRHPTPATPQDLTKHACLRYAHHTSPSTWDFQGPQGEVTVRVQGPLQINNSLAICTAAVGGMGIALVPDFISEEAIRNGSLVQLLAEYVPSKYRIFALLPPSKFQAAKTHAMIEFLQDQWGTDSAAPSVKT